MVLERFALGLRGLCLSFSFFVVGAEEEKPPAHPLG